MKFNMYSYACMPVESESLYLGLKLYTRNFLELRIQVHIYCKFTKNFYIHCATFALLLLLGCDYQPGLFLLNCRYYCPAPLNRSFFRQFLVHLDCIFRQNIKILLNILFLLDFLFTV